MRSVRVAVPECVPIPHKNAIFLDPLEAIGSK